MSNVSAIQGYSGGNYSTYGGNYTGNFQGVQDTGGPHGGQHIGGPQCQCENEIGDETQQPDSGPSEAQAGEDSIMQLLMKLLQALLGQSGATGGNGGNGLDGNSPSQPPLLTI